MSFLASSSLSSTSIIVGILGVTGETRQIDRRHEQRVERDAVALLQHDGGALHDLPGVVVDHDLHGPGVADPIPATWWSDTVAEWPQLVKRRYYCASVAQTGDLE